MGDLLHDRSCELLRAAGGVATFAYGSSRPPANALPLLDSLSDEEATELMKGAQSNIKARAWLGLLCYAVMLCCVLCSLCRPGSTFTLIHSIHTYTLIPSLKVRGGSDVVWGWRLSWPRHHQRQHCALP